jgi:hypothetical protein
MEAPPGTTAPAAAIAAPADPEPAFRSNRLFIHPVTSFLINGLNGRYERRFADRRHGLGIPFYLGRQAIRGIASEATWGGGLALTWFLTRRIQTARFTVAADWVDVRRADYIYSFEPGDPSFPSAGGEADVYHLHAFSASALAGYRWEYPEVPFTVDLDFGVSAFGTSSPIRDVRIYNSSRTGLWVSSGVYPVVQFSFGLPF